jgi:ribosomal-protein-alanine N-acetyltransferase
MITIHEPKFENETDFLKAAARSQSFHNPWVNAPKTSEDFKKYIQRSQEKNEKYFLVFKEKNIAGAFNLSAITLGCFQSSYLGFYVFSGYENQGIMSAGLKLVLDFALDRKSVV